MKNEKNISPRAKATRSKIIVAAIDSFRKHGVQGASVDLVAEQAGVTKPTLYSHFGSKDNLFDAVIDTIKKQAIEETWPSYQPDQPLLDQIQNIFNDHIENRLTPKNRQLFRALLIELTRRGDQESLSDDHPRVMDLTAILEAAQADGVIEMEEPEVVAKALLSMLKGQFFWPVLLGVEKIKTKGRKEELAAVLKALMTPMLLPRR